MDKVELRGRGNRLTSGSATRRRTFSRQKPLALPSDPRYDSPHLPVPKIFSGRHSQVVRQRSAKPRLPGSNPGAASLPPHFLPPPLLLPQAAPSFSHGHEPLHCSPAMLPLIIPKWRETQTSFQPHGPVESPPYAQAFPRTGQAVKVVLISACTSSRRYASQPSGPR
jgi:hypothetical protein